MRRSHTESLFLKLRIRGQTARSTDPFVKMNVSPRRNGQFAAGPESRSAILNDSTAVLSGLELIASQQTRSRQVEICSIHQFMD